MLGQFPQDFANNFGNQMEKVIQHCETTFFQVNYNNNLSELWVLVFIMKYYENSRTQCTSEKLNFGFVLQS